MNTRTIRNSLVAGLALAFTLAFSAAAQETPGDAPTTKPASPQHDDTTPLAYVLISTSKGDIAVELDREHAPITVANFLKYVDAGFYKDTIFHRVMPNFMIQGGGLNADMQEKPTEAPIKNEWQNGLKNSRGTIAMARRPQPDSATAQFFINVVDNPMLDQPNGGAAYAVFGKVVGGMKVVDAIRMVQTGNKGGHQNVPVEVITITSVNRISKEGAMAVDSAKPGVTSPTAPPTKP
jgi:cyclophilin family peptidyl-prolyl cis-trans isomerase